MIIARNRIPLLSVLFLSFFRSLKLTIFFCTKIVVVMKTRDCSELRHVPQQVLCGEDTCDGCYQVDINAGHHIGMVVESCPGRKIVSVTEEIFTADGAALHGGVPGLQQGVRMGRQVGLRWRRGARNGKKRIIHRMYDDNKEIKSTRLCSFKIIMTS